MSWVEVFAVLLVSHLAGTSSRRRSGRSTNKFGGLARDRERRRALLSHILTYTLCFVPALVWLSEDVSAAGLAGIAALIALPHWCRTTGAC